MTLDRMSGQSMFASAGLAASPPPLGDIWAEFKPAQMRLDGIVIDASLDSADPTLNVRGPDGRNWTVELADRRRNQTLGLTRAALLPGDSVHVVGRRTQRFGEQRIKALRLTVEGRSFELFPELEPA
jgi:hypothetical protein